MISQGILWLGLASGIISYIISEAKIFEWLRNWITDKNTFFCHLVKCGFCLGVWVSMILELIYQPNLLNKIPIIDHILTGFIIAIISAVTWMFISIVIYIKEKSDK